LTSEYGSKKPDLALIDRDYRAWWVVEVELAHHSLHHHVLPETTSRAVWLAEAAKHKAPATTTL
jgi:hypothetical protein